MAGGQVCTVVPFGSANERNDLRERVPTPSIPGSTLGETRSVHVHVGVHPFHGARDRGERLSHECLRTIDLVLCDDLVRLEVGDAEAGATELPLVNSVQVEGTVKRTGHGSLQSCFRTSNAQSRMRARPRPRRDSRRMRPS